MKVLFVAGEALPYIKTGGLADVMGSLPKELVKKGIDARVCIPLYKPIAEKYFDTFKYETSFDFYTGSKLTPVTVYSATSNGVVYYFIQHAGYFERDVCYGYDDDGERFAYFQLAVVEMLNKLDYFPDIIHTNDWHTGMIPFLCHIKYGQDERYANTKQVFMIHNLAYQGNYSADILSLFGVDKEYFNNGTLRMWDGISYLKAGVTFANKIMTVSKTYSKEIRTPEFGEHMDLVLSYRAMDLYGVVNGIDIDLWNPETDKCLAKNYTKKSFTRAKAANKKALQEELGLKVEPNTMLIGMVSRLTWQKGVYIMTEELENILNKKIQIVILGNGEEKAESAFRAMEENHKGQAVYYSGYNEELAHRIYASCDCFLMPSLFEPCGISQSIAMHYGTLPIVRETGGLKDTVIPYNEYTGEGTGFSFSRFDGYDMLKCIEYALETYTNRKEDFKKLITSAMAKDVSWNHSAEEYIDIYKSM